MLSGISDELCLLENLSYVNSTYKANVFDAGFFSVLISSPENIEDVYALAPIIVVMIIMTRQALYGTSPSLMWFYNLGGIVLYLLDKYLFLWILVAKIIA